MAYDVHAMLEAVAATVVATWADVLPPGGGGLWSIDEIENQAFDTVAEIGFPFAVRELEPAGPGGYGLTNSDFTANLNVYYVTREALTQETLWDKLEELRRPMFVMSHAGLNVIDCIGHNAHPSNPILNFFLMRFVPYTAGLVTFQLNYGESAL